MKKNIVLIIFFGFLFNTSLAKSYFGSIYVNQSTGIMGFSSNYQNQKTAINAASSSCHQKNKGKKGKCIPIVSWFSDQCAAAAWSPRTLSARGAVHDNSVAAAKQKAMSACVNKEGEDAGCRVIVAFCTSWETWCSGQVKLDTFLEFFQNMSST